MANLNGPFREIIPMFQKYKKSIGYKYDNIKNYEYIDKKLYEERICDLKDTKKIYEILITNESDENKKSRNYKCLVQLYNFMNMLGYTNLYIEPLYFKIKHKKAIILTKKEIETFFNKVDEYSKKENNLIYPVIFRLIYSCGLRVSEVISIKHSDFSLSNQSITIVKSKNNRTRIIPLSQTMFEVIKKYLKIKNTKDNKYLFEKNGKKIAIDKLEKVIKKLCNKEGIRVHDLRHTFAVHTLNNLFDSKTKSSDVIYILSVYMGHDSIKSTEYYLQFTKEHYKKVVNKFNKTYPNIFPKVGDRK